MIKKNNSSFFENKGIGVGLRPTHHEDFIFNKPKSVSWVEVISENFMPWKGYGFGKSLQLLKKVRQDYPVALHGVSMNLGSADDLDEDYLKRLKSLINVIEPFMISDHLSWTGVNGENLHDLLPIPYTKEALDLISKKIDQVQNVLGRRILIENPSSYLEFKQSEMSEAEFIQELVIKADCGLLLDVNNIYVSSINHGFDAVEYIKKIPAQNVGQIHLAGHSKVKGYLIDTHDTPVCEEVWQLYKWAIGHLGLRSAMIERDGDIPEWNELEKEILKIGEINEQIQHSR
ncbi:MAG: DUF692 domain-containing protein [Bdellovibrionales bacterium]|nr:DUF692 domain-containing protein [Bdellovibrionales bacterium]